MRPRTPAIRLQKFEAELRQRERSKAKVLAEIDARELTDDALAIFTLLHAGSHMTHEQWVERMAKTDRAKSDADKDEHGEEHQGS